jgi:hypothetical protein
LILSVTDPHSPTPTFQLSDGTFARRQGAIDQHHTASTIEFARSFEAHHRFGPAPSNRIRVLQVLRMNMDTATFGLTHPDRNVTGARSGHDPNRKWWPHTGKRDAVRSSGIIHQEYLEEGTVQVLERQ